MNLELADLYQQIILDHYRSPRGQGKLASATHHHSAINPLCGDEVSVSARVVNGVIEDLRHESSGCAICVSSASMMVELCEGKGIDEFVEFAARFLLFVRGESESIGGKLAAFGGVAKFPMRVKCATLAWHALDSALKDNDRE